MSIARQFLQDLTKRFGRTQSRAEGQGQGRQQPSSGIESALAARATRRQRAQLDRTRSGAHKALRGLRFIISNKANNAWTEVQANFDRLACDGFLSRLLLLRLGCHGDLARISSSSGSCVLGSIKVSSRIVQMSGLQFRECLSGSD